MNHVKTPFAELTEEQREFIKTLFNDDGSAYRRRLSRGEFCEAIITKHDVEEWCAINNMKVVNK